MENSEMKTTKRYLAIIIAVIIIVIIWLFRSCGSGTTPENATQTQDVVIEDASVEVEVPDESIAEEPGEAESVIEETAEAAAEETSADVFSDVNDPKHPYYDAIVWASENNITKGYVDGSFGIDDTCTRGQAVMFLWRMDGCPEPEQAEVSPFTDVPEDAYYTKAVLWAAEQNIASGTSESGQIMTFIWRYKGQPAPEEVSESPFSDVEPSHAYYKAILWGSQEGVTKGYTTGPDAGKFGIDDACTRGQIVTFLYRIR